MDAVSNVIVTLVMRPSNRTTIQSTGSRKTKLAAVIYRRSLYRYSLYTVSRKSAKFNQFQQNKSKGEKNKAGKSQRKNQEGKEQREKIKGKRPKEESTKTKRRTYLIISLHNAVALPGQPVHCNGAVSKTFPRQVFSHADRLVAGKRCCHRHKGRWTLYIETIYTRASDNEFQQYGRSMRYLYIIACTSDQIFRQIKNHEFIEFRQGKRIKTPQEKRFGWLCCVGTRLGCLLHGNCFHVRVSFICSMYRLFAITYASASESKC